MSIGERRRAQSRAHVERPTIYTVAERAGVSIATVSRALAGHPSVRPDTRERVLHAARQLGWEPPSGRNAPSRSLALVFPNLDGPFYLEVVRAVEAVAGEKGYHVSILGTRTRAGRSGGTDVEAFEAVARLLGKSDGMIVTATALAPDDLHRLRRRGVPVVALGGTADATTGDGDRVLTTNYEGAYAATVHLLGHGYRHIALIAGPDTSPEARERERGYRAALAAHGLAVDEGLVIGADFRQPGGYAAMERLLDLAEPPRAVFAANDEMALGVIEAIKGHGLRVPGDVAVAGFDDVPLAAHVHPALTTVRQPLREFARVAVERLVARIGGDGRPPETLVLPAMLVPRHSCGCDGASGE